MKKFSWTFRLLTHKKVFHLFGKGPDHCVPERAINDFAGKKVVEVCGGGFGVNLKIVDEQAWSDYISMHVDDSDDKEWVLNLPAPPSAGTKNRERSRQRRPRT